jgi:hypothetical protein
VGLVETAKRLLGRTPARRYSAGTVPEVARGARVEDAEATPAPPRPRRHCDQVTDDDVAAAFGLAVADAEIRSEFGLTQAEFTLDAPGDRQVLVLIWHHTLFEHEIDDPQWWPRDDILGEIAGVGDGAFVTRHGGVVARLGARWTALVAAGEPDGDWAPPAEQSIDLLRRVLNRLSTLDASSFPPGDSEDRWYEKYREARRKDVLDGLPLHEVDAREDARFERERRWVSLVAGFAIAVLLVSQLGPPPSLPVWLIVLIPLAVVFAGALWLVVGMGSPARERRDRALSRQPFDGGGRGEADGLDVRASAEPWEIGGPGRPKSERLRSRLAVAAFLVLLGSGSAALTRGLFHESGSAALSGEVSRARVVEDCTGFRTERCQVLLVGSERTPVGGKTFLHTMGLRPEPGDVLRVRYRSGDAVPVTLPERGAHLGLLVVCALVATACLGASLIALFGLRGRVLEALGWAFGWAIALTLGATLLLGFLGPSAVVAHVPDVTDPYAAVAAEPERTAVAQGVRFSLVRNRPLAQEVCARVPACLAAASAEWTVTGTDLEARSWMGVFADEKQADAAVSAVVADPGIVGELPLQGWVSRGSSPGRFLIVVHVGRPGATDVKSDLVATQAADALRILSTEPAVEEIFE